MDLILSHRECRLVMQPNGNVVEQSDAESFHRLMHRAAKVVRPHRTGIAKAARELARRGHLNAEEINRLFAAVGLP